MADLTLAQISGSVSGTSTSIDPKGYLTDLNSVHIKTEAEIGYDFQTRSWMRPQLTSN